jgi:ADP-ribosylglycohydrolase
MTSSQPSMCPKCQGHSLKNINSEESGRHAAHAAHLAHGGGPLAMMAAGIGAWLLGELVHSDEEQWQCKSCYHKFHHHKL